MSKLGSVPSMPSMPGLAKVGKLRLPKSKLKRPISLKGMMKAKLVSFHKQGLLKSPGSPMGHSGKIPGLSEPKGWGTKV